MADVTHMGRPTLIGVRTPRIEDDRLVTGRGRYVADVTLPGALSVVFVRSHLPHARLRRVNCQGALRSPGVVAVLAGNDLDEVSSVPDFFDWARPVGQFPLARDRVRYVGTPLAVVVAEDRYLAEDAAELVDVDLDPLPAVTSIEQSLAPDAPRLYDGWPDNVLVATDPSVSEVDDAMSRLRVIRGEYVIQRHGAVPMEPRGVVANYCDDRLTVWTSTQFPHIVRTMLSYVLTLPERAIRVIAPDVGGGFGGKSAVYPEEYVVAWLAMRLHRPVRWIEDRHEHMVSACHARDMRIDLAAAVHDDGTIEALRGNIVTDLGSGEMYPNGFAPSFVAVGAMSGPYRIPHQCIGVTGVVTNKTPTGAYRGFGIPEAAFAMERLVDRIGRELDIDPVELRRRMIIEPDELPYETASGARLDTGSHRKAFDRAVELGERMLAEERERHCDEVRVGVGYATYVEGVASTYWPASGNWTAQDAADIRFDPDGGVTVAVGISAYGQGVTTMVATLVAEELAVPTERVRVVMGDTDTAPYGLGSWGSRSSVVAGGAISRAAASLRAKGTTIAAHLLEAAEQDLELLDNRFQVRGDPGQFVTWEQVARTALTRTLALPPDVEPGLDAKVTYQPPGIEHVPRPDGRMNAAATYTNATHAAVVGVDPATGVVSVLRYAVVHDCGRVINPMIVAGQVHGGVAQGIGGTLYEEFRYDENGQPLATTFMDYLVPTAEEIPPIHLEEFESPAPDTAFGIKGAGEAGIIGPAAAIVRAAEHALEEFGIREITATPLSPSNVRRAIQEVST